MIKQAIIPLAGLGTRLLPLTSVFAKELLPINGKPGIEYILDECIEAGIKEVVFIIYKGKLLIQVMEILVTTFRKKFFFTVYKFILKVPRQNKIIIWIQFSRFMF